MIDLRARNNDADLGRFTTRDPVDSLSAGPGNAGNPYAYAANDPLDRSDPLGLLAIPLPGDYVGTFRVPPHVVAPAAGQRADAPAAVHLTAARLADGEDIDYTTAHNVAVAVARAEFVTQLPALWSDFYPDIEVPNAGKAGAADGEIDLTHVKGKTALVWEVKKDTRYGGPAGASKHAADETKNYVNEWNKQPAKVGGTKLAGRFARTRAWPGVGLANDVPMPAVPGPGGTGGAQWHVYSLYRLIPNGAVLYGPQKKQPDRTPVWWWSWIFSLLGIQKRAANKESGQPVGQPVGQRGTLTPLFPLSPGTVPAKGAFRPFLPPAYTSVYGLEPPRA